MSLLHCAALAALLLSALPSARAADDGQRVHRCIGRHGEIVFSGLACQAEPAANGAQVPAPAAPPADRCAGSREELRTRIAAAIAHDDPNALAGLARWHGIGARAVSAHLRTLRELSQGPLLAIEDDAFDGGVRVRTGGGAAGGVHEHVFGVGTTGGCYWLDW